MKYSINMQKSFWNIYKTFFKIGALLLGGGYVILPLLQSEICEKKFWIATEELTEYFALSQSLPGIIAVNISIFTGYKLLKIRGAIAALAGVITPAFLAIILIANILAELVKHRGINFIFSGVAVGVVILALLTIKEMWGKSVVDKFAFIIFIVSAALSLLKVSPAIIIVGCVGVGVLYKLAILRHDKRGEK